MRKASLNSERRKKLKCPCLGVGREDPGVWGGGQRLLSSLWARRGLEAVSSSSREHLCVWEQAMWMLCCRKELVGGAEELGGMFLGGAVLGWGWRWEGG